MKRPIRAARVAGTDEASMLRRVTTYQIWKLP